MEFAFRIREPEKAFNAADAVQRTYGTRIAAAIMMRMAVLRAARNMAPVLVTRPERRHKLSADRDGQFAADLVRPFCIVLEANHEPVPRRKDGGINPDEMTAIRILEMIGHH